MALGAIRSLLAVAKSPERMANGSRWIDPDMCIAAVVVGAVAAQKVQACRDAIGRGLVRQVTTIAQRAVSSQQIVFADGNLVRIMHITALWSFGARSWCLRQSDLGIRTG